MMPAFKRAFDMVPLAGKLLALIVVISITISTAAASFYADYKTKQLEEEIALEIVEVGGRFQKELSNEGALTPPKIRKALAFLSVFPYVKCAEYVVDGKARGAWPIPICAPILKKNPTRPVDAKIGTSASLIFHIDRAHIETIIATERLVFLGIVSTMLGMIGLGVIVFMLHQVSRPFRHIAHHLEADEDGIVKAVPPKGGREFQRFINAYNQLVDDVIAKTAEVTAWRTRIRAELEQADAVQNLLVPEQIVTPMIDARAVSLRELSGDFHEVYNHADGRQTFILGDVAGKGIYAAMMLAQTLTAFRSAAEEYSLPKMLVKLNTLIEDRFPDGLFVALSLLRISADGQSAELFVTGNPDAVLITPDGRLTLYPSVGPAIGVLPPMIYEMQEAVDIDLTQGRLYLFSDGVSDLIVGPDGEGFDDDAALHEFLKTIDKAHGDNALDALMDAFKQYEQVDDVTIARVRVKQISE